MVAVLMFAVVHSAATLDNSMEGENLMNAPQMRQLGLRPIEACINGCAMNGIDWKGKFFAFRDKNNQNKEEQKTKKAETKQQVTEEIEDCINICKDVN